jgi:uncharacterized protein YdiU (UPF0061 family)
MECLGIPTTRSLAAILTGEVVQREIGLPGAVLTRVARSHVRVGTFEYFSSRDDIEGVKILANHVIKNNFPLAEDSKNPYKSMLKNMIKNQAKLIAFWQLTGFIHGVMNTDNCSVVGDTIDYGPCAFMDDFNPSTVFSSIDRRGRYSYKNQPLIAQWNLACLAETLVPLLNENHDNAIDIAKAELSNFQSTFESEYLKIARRKLGFFTEHPDDLQIFASLLRIMEKNKADFTLTFRGLSSLITDKSGTDNSLYSLFPDKKELSDWIKQWTNRCLIEPQTNQERRSYLKSHNPSIIPRNHLIEKVIRSAVDEKDFVPFYNLNKALETPFNDIPHNHVYKRPPTSSEVVEKTFCGT